MNTLIDHKMEEYEAELKALFIVLRGPNSPYPARALASLLECSKPTVYARIKELKARKIPVKYTMLRDGLHGPKSRAFYIDNDQEWPKNGS